MAELGVDFHLVDGAREIERGLNPDMPLHAAVHLPQDEVGNCQQFAQPLRHEAQRLGAVFKFQRNVTALVSQLPVAPLASSTGGPSGNSGRAPLQCCT